MIASRIAQRVGRLIQQNQCVRSRRSAVLSGLLKHSYWLIPFLSWPPGQDDASGLTSARFIENDDLFNGRRVSALAHFE